MKDLSAFALGGCLWWVAQRQCSPQSAALSLALYVASPIPLRSGTAGLAALGLFAMLYTGLGVAHALQGPRRKWVPRIALMTAFSASTSAIQPLAAYMGLLLVLVADVYLAERRRSVLFGVFAVWAAAALAGSHFFVQTQASPSRPGALANLGLLLAFAAAFGFWCASRRARFFGNSAPLVAAALLLGLQFWAGAAVYAWALPPALLFLAGVAEDAFGSRAGRFWARGLCILSVLQISLLLLV